MPDVQTGNLGESMNPSGGVAGGFGSSMPNIPQQQIGNNPSWMQQAGAWMNSDSMSQGMGGMMGGMSNGDMIMQSDQMGGQLFGLLAGQNQSTVGNVMKSMPGMSTIGNLWNAAFGSHINEEFVKQTELGTNAIKSHIFNSNTNADVLNDWRNTVEMSHVSKDEVGSDGWFSKKAKNKTNALNNAIDNANALQMMNFAHAVTNADKNTDLRIMQNMAAYGGPINSFRKYYEDGGLFGNETVDNIAQFVPILGTAEDAYTFYKDPSWANAGWLALSLGSDIFTGGMAGKAIKALRMANKAADASRTAQKAAKAAWETSKRGRATGQVSGADNLRTIRALQAANATRQAAIKRANQALGQAATAVGLDQSANIGSNVAQSYDKGGYLAQAKALIRNNEGFLEKPYHDAPKGKNWRSVGYGFNDSGFREKYPEGISKHYEHGITKKQAEEELDYFLNRAEKTLKGIYGKQWNDFTDNQKAAILDTYYQRPASVGKSSRFYKAVTAGEDAGRYLGVAGFTKRNNIRQNVFGGGQYNYADVNYSDNPDATSSSLQEETFIPIVQGLDLSGITPTQAKALELNLSSPAFDLSMFGKSTPIAQQQQTPTIGTVDDFLRSYGDFDDNLFGNGGWMDFFSAWNSAQGGNNYFANMGGNQWKPADGLQVNSSNGNVGDWLGVASTVTNTLSNWGKEDPSLGRGGGYSQFGMAAYDLMKGIRDMTKQRKEPMDQKLGIPIYARGGRLFADGGDVGALGYAQIGTAALKLASNAKHQASLDDDIDEGKINRSIDRQGYSFDDAVSNVQTNGDLLDLWRNYSEMPTNLTMRDFRDQSLFDDFLNGYAASWEGFNAGQNFGPWGAAIGAIVGGLSSNISSIIGRNKASNAADDANKRLERANERMLADLNYGAERVDAENDLRILQNMDTVSNAANGGKLNVDFGLKSPFVMPDGTANPLFKAFGGGLTHGSNFDTGINWVNEGGSHGENPLGGVPMGMDEQGIPNLVEEGEAIWNGDYVFSKRMKVPKKLRDKYKLPDDATFADAVAKLTQDSEERPLSNIDRATNNHILGEFADTQEEMRMAKAQRAMDREMQLRDDFITGFNVGAFGGSLFSDGGGIHIDPSKKGTFKAQASKMGMGVQEAASHILANKENYSPAMVKKANFAKNFAHADGGSLFTNPFESNIFVDGGTIKKFQEGMKASGQYTNEQIDQLAYQKYGEDAWKYRLSNKNWENGYDSRTGKNYIRYNDPNAPQATSNRAVENSSNVQSTGSQLKEKPKSQPKASGTKSISKQVQSGSIVPFAYDWYRNGSDGYSTPTGFKVGDNGRAYDYTDEYRNLVNSLGANDIRKWAAEHPDDSSLKSFLARGNKLENLTDEQWRKGATDGKYGFMHHVADQIGKEKAATRAMTDEEFAAEYPMIARPSDEVAPTNWTDGSIWGNTGTTKVTQEEPIIVDNKFKPKPTWMRQVPIWMSGLAALRGELTPADYTNADAITAAAYQAGQPVSVGTEYVGDYRKRDPFDERYLENIINQRGLATDRNMMNLSGGNRATAMSGILVNDLTNQMALAEAARQAYLGNRADDVQVSDFNYRTNKGNADAQNARNLALANLNSHRQQAMLSGIAQGARLRQAIKDQRDAAISANWTNFAQGMGDWGKENGFYNMLGGLNEEGVLKYFYGDNWKTMFNNNQQNG